VNGLIAWFAQNSVAANLVMTVLVVAGTLSLGMTGKELIPAISLDVLLVNTAYPGASASEVERVVTARVEQAVSDLPSVTNMRSLSRPHLGVVSLEVGRAFSVQEVRESVQKRLDSIVDWPSAVERPLITQVAVQRDLVTNLVLYGQADPAALKALAEKVKLQLLDATGVTQVQINQHQEYVLDILLSEMALQRYAISFSEVASAIRRQTKDAVGGQLKVMGSDGSIMVRGRGLDVETLENLVVRSLPDGGRILLQDVAFIEQGLAEGLTGVAFNGQQAIYLSVYRVGEQDILKISQSVSQFADFLQETLPDGISVALWQNMARYYDSRITMLKENALIGSGILFLVLLCFLNLRLSFWVSLGVPIAFLGAFWVLPMVDGTLNMVSLFAFILVLGIVVDDAIIVGENIYTHQNNNRPGLRGAIFGAQQVARPVVFAALTTMVMFAPLLFLPSNEGKLVQIIPIVVISVLAFSLIESLLILPAHLSNSNNVLDRMSWLNLTFISRGMEKIIMVFYRPVLRACLRWRLSVIAFFIVCFILSLGLVSTGWLKFTFFSPIAADKVTLSVKYAEGTDPKIISEEINRFSQIAGQIKKDLERVHQEQVIEHIVTLYGQTLVKKDARIGAVVLALKPSENRVISGEAISELWRKKIGEDYQAKKLKFESSLNETVHPLKLSYWLGILINSSEPQPH